MELIATYSSRICLNSVSTQSSHIEQQLKLANETVYYKDDTMDVFSQHVEEPQKTFSHFIGSSCVPLSPRVVVVFI